MKDVVDRTRLCSFGSDLMMMIRNREIVMAVFLFLIMCKQSKAVMAAAKRLHSDCIVPPPIDFDSRFSNQRVLSEDNDSDIKANGEAKSEAHVGGH